MNECKPLADGGHIVYAVPGDPCVAENSVVERSIYSPPRHSPHLELYKQILPATSSNLFCPRFLS